MPSVTLDLELLRRWPLPSDSDGDKFSRGTVLVIGGSPNTPGAAILAGAAALRMGAGRLQIATDAGAVTATAVAVPEALVSGHSDPDELIRRVQQAACVLVGPGLIEAELAGALLEAVLAHAGADTVVVVDAIALDVIADVDRKLIDDRRGRLVATPNRQELAGLAAAFEADETVESVAVAIGAVVTSFDDVAAPDGRRWQSAAGHPSLGTSGSGDVLAGFIAGAAARCGDAAQAACWGTLAHQLAGERLGAECGHLGFLARHLLDAVVPALASIGGAGD
jgi:ADP-dependent NAD(P)H-hydrate dehydratase